MHLVAWSVFLLPVVLNASPITIRQPSYPSYHEQFEPRKFDIINPRSISMTKSIIHELQMAPSLSERMQILLPDPGRPGNLTFRFINNTVGPSTGGTIALSHVDNFPALDITNMAMAIGFLGACGLNTPHWHPRSNEFLTVVQGQIRSGLILENIEGGEGNVVGGNPMSMYGPQVQVNITLSNFTGALFPQGAVHFQFNPSCEPAIFASAFDNNDPGRSQVARSFFSIRPDSILQSSIGNPYPETIDAKDLEELRQSIPATFASLIDHCVARCGLK